MSEQLPKYAQVVIIGGGIIGCSIAYHLTKAGWTDVVVLERKTLASGTTWAAAGLVGQLRQNRQMSNLAKYGTELYASLEAETGVPTGYVRNGAISLCQTQDRYKEYLRAAARARAFDIDMHIISKKEALDMVPGMNLDNCLDSVFYLPNDAQVNPEDTTQAFAKGARMYGAKIFENILVTDISTKRNEICGVSTEEGDIVCQYVVNAAGMWSRALARQVGVSLPHYAAEHMHAVTKPIPGYKEMFPCVRDLDGYTYFKAEGGGLLFGGSEPVGKPWGQAGIPKDFKYTRLQEDWDQFSPFMDCALYRFPAIENAEIRHLEVVPESFSADAAYMFGEAPGIKNFYVATGMNSVGIASAAGVGRAITQMMTQGYPEEELWPVDVRRFYYWQQNDSYLFERVKEAVGINYEHHYPYKSRTSSRNVIKTALYDRLAAAGAAFTLVAGWERADFFVPEGVEAKHKYDWDSPNWLPYQKEEHMAIRENVGLYEVSPMSKFIVQGRDAEEVLQYLCTNDISGPIGKVTYTPVVNERGGFELDITVTRTGEDEYFIISTTNTTTRDIDYFRRHFPKYSNVTITDVTHGWAGIAVMGPNARKVLQKITDQDLSNEAFPYSTAKYISVGMATSLALRMSYVGELGWELYVPTNFVVHMYEAILEAGKEFGIRHVGNQAVNSLRTETGYRHWETDITPDDTPYEAGLGFGVKLYKGCDFIGRNALIAQKNRPLSKRVIQLVLTGNNKAMVYGNEPIFRDGVHVGELSTGAYGFLIGTGTGLGYVLRKDGAVDKAWLDSGKWEVDVQGEMVAATASFSSPYDPKNERVRM